MTRSLKISVIIPAYSPERLVDLKKSIKSIQTQTHKPTEIIIPIDHNEELLGLLIPTLKDSITNNLKVVLNTGTIGGAETRNVGIHNSIGDIVAFTDDDAQAHGHWLEELLKHYSNPRVLAVGGKTVSIWETKRPQWFPEELDWLVGGTWKGYPEESCEVRNLIGPNMSFRKEVCQKIGYMRSELGALGTGFRAGDETEFYIRLKHHFPDGRVLYEPKAIVYHKASISIPILFRKSYSLGYYKSHTSKILLTSTKKPFAEEKRFLFYLLLKALPEKLKKAKIFQAGAIAASITACGLGYLWGKMAK